MIVVVYWVIAYTNSTWNDQMDFGDILFWELYFWYVDGFIIYWSYIFIIQIMLTLLTYVYGDSKYMNLQQNC